MEIESITASAAWGAVMTPQAASASAAGSVPMSVEGNSAKRQLHGLFEGRGEFTGAVVAHHAADLRDTRLRVAQQQLRGAVHPAVGEPRAHGDAIGGYSRDFAGAVQATNEMSGTMIEYINGIEVIKVFNQGRKSYARLVDKVKANAQYYYDWMRRSQLGMSAPIVAAFNFVDTLAQVGTTVAQVDEILKAEEQTHSETPVTFDGHSIEFRDVSFGYHDGKEILHGVSLTIPQNGMTALVGPSGSGKSTLAKLAAGFWDVKTGTITMGGHDLRDIPLPQLYEQVAFVSQDNYLFDDTVRENIRMGRMSATDAEVEAAAGAAGCDSFIGGLEHGYDTIVGGGGAHLSGGERQRIAIARAILKDAPIIVLDEATAYIGPENEDRLQKAIEALLCTVSVIRTVFPGGAAPPA